MDVTFEELSKATKLFYKLISSKIEQPVYRGERPGKVEEPEPA